MGLAVSSFTLLGIRVVIKPFPDSAKAHVGADPCQMTAIAEENETTKSLLQLAM